MKPVVVSVFIMLAFTASVRAQTDGVERLAITVEGATVSSPGGEQASVGGSAIANETGKMARHGFSWWSDRCNFGVSRSVEPNADLGWAVEITPLRVVGDA